MNLKIHQIKCCSCGKFMTPEPGSSWVFIPDSYLSYEEDRWQCKKCTEEFGPITPTQSIREDMCCGVVK